MAKPMPLDPPVTNAVAPLRFIVQSPDDVACCDVSTAAARSAQERSTRERRAGDIECSNRSGDLSDHKKMLRQFSNRPMVGQDVDETLRRQATHKRIEAACGADTESVHKLIRCTDFLKR